MSTWPTDYIYLIISKSIEVDSKTLTVSVAEVKTPPKKMSWVWHKTGSGSDALLLKIGRMRSTSPLPLLQGPLRSGVRVPN